MALAYCGIALLADSLWALAILPAVLLIVDRGVVVREERFLARKFGQDYARYMRRTRRWL
jgi:protein-S-isoprenylcysteine O-methyltransferase Ste14